MYEMVILMALLLLGDEIAAVMVTGSLRMEG